MSHPRFLALAGPAVAAAALLFASGAQAGPHGGGGGGGHHGRGGYHGGGGHYGGGGYHGGGGHYAGGYHGGYGGYGYHHGGYGGYGYHHGYYPYHHHYGYGYGYGGVGIYLGSGYGYPYGYYGGSYYPAYDLDYSAPAYVAPSAPLYAPAPAVVPDYRMAAEPPPPDLTAHVAVRAPADAEIWFGEGKTRQTGAVREFVSPALTPGKEYTYEVKARWTEGGKEKVETRRVDVSAGTWKSVDFTKPAGEAVDSPKPGKP